ncbi:hypothetical protein HHI36_018468 [Cryptolaemus montrouzieri]|uniref:Uncharacterized protein n=1 Tax=Cryptolaemus montrouzieri TaxID=559131 RepID=A0ABD2P0I7_9CUCU
MNNLNFFLTMSKAELRKNKNDSGRIGKISDDLGDEKGDDQCDLVSDDSMKDPDVSIKKKGSQWQDPTDYESSEEEDDEETHDI